MADDEQFSLCWNNFNSNLSAGFHESLCRGDLVDVTLAAEGQFVKAHRLVLSVCSPYFRRMFTQMPANQHAFVFLKDVSHTALKDLIQFMYCGEVNVKQDALPAFISTAEALQIKGLTDSEPAPSQSPAKPSTPAPQPQPQTITTPTMTTATTTTSPRARTSNQRSRYKLESEDSGDENKPTNQLVLQQTQTTQQHQQATLVQQTQKRPAQRSITPHTAPTVKRIKNNDPLEGTDATTTTTQITVQAVTDSKSATGEPEYIDLPIDLPTKSEPDYGEEAADVEAAEQEATYVEDDSYGDMKYDESYFTENEEGGGTTTGATTSTAAVKQSVSFSDSYVSDTGEQQQAATEAQGNSLTFIKSPWATPCLVLNGYMYNRHSKRNGKAYWRCHNYSKRQIEFRCRARCVIENGKIRALTGGSHNHLPHTEKIAKILRRNSIVTKAEVCEDDGEDDEPIDVDQLRYRNSIKGNLQLCVDGYPFTKHRVTAFTTYWRCVQFRPFGCRARIRTKSDGAGQQVEIVDRHHNHSILTQRRKKGSLKALYAARKKSNEDNIKLKKRTRQ